MIFILRIISEFLNSQAIIRLPKIDIKIYTNPKSQRNNGLFCKLCTSQTCIHLNVSINIMPSYLSITSNISFNHQCLKLEETTNFVEVGCLKNELHANLPVFGM